MKQLFCRFRLFIFIIGAQSFANTSHSQINFLNTVYVSEERESDSEPNKIQASESLTSEIIDSLLPSSLDDILKVSAGTTTTGGPRSSSESVQIRGLEASKLYIYVDGVKQNFRTDHNTMIAVDYDNLKSAQIEKDNSNFKRSGSLGGGLVLVTKDARDFLSANEKYGSNFKISNQNSNNELGVNLKSYAKMNQNRGSLLVSMGHKSASDSILANNYTLPNSSYKDYSLLGKYDYKFSNSLSVDFGVDYFKRLDSVPINPTFDPPDNIDELNGKNEIEKLGIRGKLKNKDTSIQMSNNRQTLQKIRNSDKAREFREIESNSLGIEQKVKFLNLGLEYQDDNLSGKRDDDTLESYPKGRAKNISLYLENETEFTSKFSINSGLKFQSFDLTTDKNQKNDEDITAKLGLRYDYLKTKEASLGVKTRFSTGFNPPKVQEVFADGLHHQGDGFFIADNYFIPNYNLSAERAQSIEVEHFVEARIFSDDLLKLSYSRYFTHFDNYIYLEKIDRAIFDNEFGSTQFVNAKDVSLNGHEVSASYLVSQFEFSLAYSKVRAINKTLGNFIASLPADQYNLGVTYFLDQFDMQLGYLGIKALKQDRINRESIERIDETPGYLVHNILISKNFKDFRVSTRFDNVTNRVYRKHSSNIVETGRDYKISLDYKINI